MSTYPPRFLRGSDHSTNSTLKRNTLKLLVAHTLQSFSTTSHFTCRIFCRTKQRKFCCGSYYFIFILLLYFVFALTMLVVMSYFSKIFTYICLMCNTMLKTFPNGSCLWIAHNKFRQMEPLCK